MKRLLLTLLLLVYPVCLSARTRYFNYAQLGGQRVTTSNFISTTTVQRSFPGALVKVCVAGSGCSSTAGTLVSIFSDSSGTPLGNPLTTGSDASFTFWSDTSPFDLVFYGPGITTSCGGAGQLPCISAFTWTSEALSSGDTTSVLAPPPSGADDYGALAALIALYQGGQTLIQLQCGVYQISQPLAMTSARITGCGFVYGQVSSPLGTTLRATTTMDAVIQPGAGIGGSAQISRLTLDAHGLATYAAHLKQSDLARFTDVWFTGARADGVWADQAYLNDANAFMFCFFTDNGTLYSSAGYAATFAGHGPAATVKSGTAACSISSPTITFTGAPDLTTLGLRDGDFIVVGTGGSAQWMQIITSVGLGGAAVTPNTVTVGNTRLPAANLTGVDWAIGRGDGIRFDLGQNVGINIVFGGLQRANAGAGINEAAAYGTRFYAIQPDINCFYGLSLGLQSNVVASPLASIIAGAYFEASANIGADFLLGNGIHPDITGIVGGTFKAAGNQASAVSWQRGFWNLPIYANNAAALAANPPGAIYRTNADPDVIAVVH